MSIFQAIILGLVQGATEFIPVSSSGHLVLVPWLLGWPAPGLVFDTMVHWGTLVAILAYFWRDWWVLITAWLRGLVRWDWHDSNARLAWLLVIGSIPAAILGLLFEDWFESLFGEPAWVSFFLLVTAAILLLSERLSHSRKTRTLANLRWPDALIIGLAQAAAIAPGISRSGATMSAGLVRGLDRPTAARFSFLLATPAILGAGLLQLVELSSTPNPLAQLPLLVAGFLAALISGYACIWGLLRYLQRGKLIAFAIYCALVGTLCLAVAWLR
ncbi:MAG: undecaprenyl-diphosphatase UppP [Anaerolineae bacterium]|nr:undecaprenyl-diphosphatase UppP [Anaerolineae bacterium]